MSELLEKKCVPCEGGVPPLPEDERSRLLEQLGNGWEIVDGHHLARDFIFPAFEAGLDFVNRAGSVAEDEGHHPNIHMDRRRVRMEIWTHKIDGLTESDFILAAKITDSIADASTVKMVDVAALKGETPQSRGTTRLTEEEANERLGKLAAGWEILDVTHLKRTFEFPDFIGALTFVNAVGRIARESGRHPGIDLVWGKVTLQLTTWTAGGLTDLDFDMAASYDALFS